VSWRKGDNDGLVWRISTALARVLLSFSTKRHFRIETTELPPKGFILAANHISHFDPPLLSVSSPGQIEWMAMAELFKLKLTGLFLHSIGAIPVDRKSSEGTPLRAALKRLEAGAVVGIFPEAGIRDGDKSILNGGQAKLGTAMLSALSGAPIVPCVILGSDRLYNKRCWLPWRRAGIWIACGQPIYPPKDLRGDARRTAIHQAMVAEMVRLKEKLIADFSLTPADLPHSPQQRMAGQ
jgi:1-acyl-sn-glycerol-3-phosphate acyltransferase